MLEKIFTPSEENHDAACWLVETAIRTRITSTRRPAASVMAWKLRSPSGRRSVSAPGGHGLMLLGDSAHGGEPIWSR